MGKEAPFLICTNGPKGWDSKEAEAKARATREGFLEEAAALSLILRVIIQ